MTGTAYAASPRKSPSSRDPSTEFEKNNDRMLKVINMHRQHAYDIPETHCPDYLRKAAKDAWDEAVDAGTKVGFRNAQVTLLAPTGTIGFMMDCDTTGVEPDIALMKYKQLAGGGMIKLVNRTVPMALERLGYTPRTSRRSAITWTKTRRSKALPKLNDGAPAGFRLRVQAARTASGASIIRPI